MTTAALHPDQLEPGHMVGTFRILEVLGAGGFGRVFKAERDGHLYALKMALRPAAAERPAQEEDVDGRLAREAAFLAGRRHHPHLLPVLAMDFWPHARGYRYLVTPYVEADTLTQWRRTARPSAARLVDVFGELVRAVADLHQHGVHHRDLKGDNVLVSRKEARLLLIDFGAAHLPGASTLTVGLPPGALHMLPPEALAFFRSEVWKEGVRFSGGVAADLYALGHLLYEALTDCHPFDPKLPPDELVAAIETVVPRAPHYINPKVPRALSDIAMRLLSKRPEERYESAEALWQALWEAAKAERKSRAWKVSVALPPGGPAPVTRQEAQERRAQQEEVARRTKEVGAAQAQAVKELEALLGLVEQMQPPAAEPVQPTGRRWWPWVVGVGGGLVLLVLALWLASPATLPPSSTSEKGRIPVTTSPQDTPRSGPVRLVALLCAFTSVGCPGAQVKPPPPEYCPQEAMRTMFDELKVTPGSLLRAIVDIHQPGDQSQLGTYQDGAIEGRITRGEGGLPEGTLLRGQLWTGPGIFEYDREAVIARYTEARLPDGRTVPVCIVLGGPDGRVPKARGSKPGAVQLPRELPANAVELWP
jgi:serine/threonine-protein kinase